MRAIRTMLVLIVAACLIPSVSTVRAQENAKILRVASTIEPPQLTPYFDSGPSYYPVSIFMQPQWAPLSDGSVKPLLVDTLPSEANGGLSVTSDGKSIIKFKLADWAVWSDGQPIVADDFKFVFDVATDGLSNMVAFRFLYGAKVTSVAQGTSEKEVVITFPGTYPEWWRAWIIPLPAHVLRAPYEAGLKEK